MMPPGANSSSSGAFRLIRRPRAPSGRCGHIRTTRTPRIGVARTCLMCTRLSRAPLSMERSIVTGRLRSAAGFTIIELMVVMSLIITLSTIAVVQYRHSVVYSKEAALKEDLFRMKEAIDQYYADKNQYPSTLDDLVSAGYLRAVPVDPITNSATTWQTIPPEPDPNNPLLIGGVYSVKSGSDASAMDGTKYNDW